jgi:malonyl-CoA O-methyltransferase
MIEGYTLDKNAVRRSFARAAATYDAAAVLVREVADRMLERLELLKAIPERVLDVGSGTVIARASSPALPR